MPRKIRIGHPRNLYLRSDQGSITLAGQDASFLRDYRVIGSGGSYLLSGQAATLTGGSWNHYFLETISPAIWADIEAQMAIWGDPNTDAQTKVNSIPTSGGVTLTNAAGNAINTALASNSIVFLSGTCSTSQGIDVPAGKSLLGIPGAETTLDCTAVTGTQGIILRSNTNLAWLNIIGPDPPSGGGQGQGVNMFGSDSTLFKLSVSDCHGTNGSGIRAAHSGGNNNVIVSCEAIRCFNRFGTVGGDSDGFGSAFGAFGNTFIDCHAYENTDDGFDFWQGEISYMYYCSSRRNGKHPTGTNVGGSGFKLGTNPTSGACSHRMYKCDSSDNLRWAWNYNSNVGPHYVIQCTNTLNGSGNYAFGTADAPGGSSPKYKNVYP